MLKASSGAPLLLKFFFETIESAAANINYLYRYIYKEDPAPRRPQSHIQSDLYTSWALTKITNKTKSIYFFTNVFSTLPNEINGK